MPASIPRKKPYKRPVQARAKFTVEAIYGAVVRIWRRSGWAAVTTRAVALEAGIAVGTLYDYFPNREALLSGYVRMQLERMLERLEREVVAAADVAWQERVRRLIRICCAEDAAREAPFFDAGLFQLEMQIAEPWHQLRVFDELSAKWREALAACPDLPHQPSPETVDALFTAVWGGRRYSITAQFEPARVESWLRQMEGLCCRCLTEGASGN